MAISRRLAVQCRETRRSSPQQVRLNGSSDSAGDCQSDAFSRSNTNSSSIRCQSAFLKHVELSKIINKFVCGGGEFGLVIMSTIKPDLELFESSMHKRFRVFVLLCCALLSFCLVLCFLREETKVRTIIHCESKAVTAFTIFQQHV